MSRAWIRFGLSLLVVAVVAGCSSSSGSGTAAGQENFGVRMAKMNLWREAMFRFQRAAQMDPDNAMIRNNLAVAYEANGDFESAAKEYREALRLDRSNQYIQKNYSRFVEFMSRNRKRQQKETKSAQAEGTPPIADASAAPPAQTAPPPVPATTTAPPEPPPAPQPPPAQPPGGGLR